MRYYCEICSEECDRDQKCEICGEYICDECWPLHDRECGQYPRFPDTDIFGNCYSDADPGL
jgi:hypothetical protein